MGIPIFQLGDILDHDFLITSRLSYREQFRQKEYYAKSAAIRFTASDLKNA